LGSALIYCDDKRPEEKEARGLALLRAGGENVGVAKDDINVACPRATKAIRRAQPNSNFMVWNGQSKRMSFSSPRPRKHL
jgi:hypothetical protein